MAQKKDFAGVNTARVYAGLEQATAAKNKQPAISPQEAEQRAEEMRTQGRAGAKLPRINMAFTPANHEFVKIMSRVTGRNMTSFTNYVIEQYRKEHPELFEQAKAIIAQL